MRDVDRLIRDLDLHPRRAFALMNALRSGIDTDALVEALEVVGGPARQSRRERYTIMSAPPKPTSATIWRHPETTDEMHEKNVIAAVASWRKRWSKVSVSRSNNLVKRAIAAMKFDWDADGEDLYDKFVERFDEDGAEDVLRNAVRPWPVQGWQGVEVGNVKFGKRKGRIVHDNNTPKDLYRLLYLFKPIGVDFDDMYGQGLFGIVSPCHRFAMSFYFHKYELAAFQFVRKEFAVQTHSVGITCGIPGADNGVTTMHKDARRFFRMIDVALRTTWDVYSGNSFSV